MVDFPFTHYVEQHRAGGRVDRIGETMEDNLLLGIYREYLACLNERRWDELGRFVAMGWSITGNS